MVYIRKILLIFVCIITLTGSAWASDTQSVAVTVEIPQINWIRMEDQHVSVESYIGFSPENEFFSYSVSATGVRPRVIAAWLERPLPRGVRVILEMGPQKRGASKGPIILSLQEKVVMTDIWGIYNSRGHGTIKIETDMNAPPEDGLLGIKFRIKEEI